VSVRRPAAEVHELIVGALRAAGCDHPNAAAVAGTLVAAERDGATSHGLFRLPGYLASLQGR
jgi:delta1-piperideine-2-carboxylate reductase